MWHMILDLFFPPRCVGCDRVDYSLCPDCCQAIERVVPPCCPRCGRAVLAPADSSETVRRAACDVCAIRPLRLDGVRATAEFRGIARRAIHALKFWGRTDLAQPLADLMAAAWEDGPFPVDCIIPVPLHHGRLRKRGYDQAVLLAVELARRIDLPVLPEALARSRMTEPQTGLDARARRRNVDGAFSGGPTNLKGRSVLLVDDVCTTRSTLQACADALRAVGAARVFAVTLARAGWDPATGAMTDAVSGPGRSLHPIMF